MNLKGTRSTYLFFVLSGVFLLHAVLAEVLGVKIFSLESSLGLAPAQIVFWGGFTLDFNLTVGVLLWPVVFLSTDIINEYFGKAGVRSISYLTAILIAYAFVIIYLATYLAPASFWQQLHSQGSSFDINYAFVLIFRQSLGIIIGSLVAFLLSQLLDVFVFQYLRRRLPSQGPWLRATGSTLVSQGVDSFVVLYLAFYILAPADKRWTHTQVLSVAALNYIYKFVVAICLTPLIYLLHYLIDKYLGKEDAQRLRENAAKSSTGFF